MLFAPVFCAFASIVTAACCPRLRQKVALAASDLMALSWVGVKPMASDPQRTPAFEPKMVRLRVCAPAFLSGLARVVLLTALAMRLLTT